MKGLKYMLLVLVLLVSANMYGQYNPSNPQEPGVYHTLTLEATPYDGGRFNVNTISEYSEGSKINLRASANSKFKFVAWVSDGITLSLDASFTYTMPAKNVKLSAIFDYSPTNPSEPSEADLPEYSKIYVVANPAEGGSFNVTSGNRYEVGSTVTLKATNHSRFVFQNWTKDGEVVSTSQSFAYVVEEEDASFVANFKYDPSSPSEPMEPALHHALQLECNPSGAGYFNIASGNSYQAGSSVYLQAYSNTWYSFVNWTTPEGEVVSDKSAFYYTMPNEKVRLVANYTYYYDPSDPNEPNEGDSKKVNIYGMTENGLRGQVLAYPIYLENPVPVRGMDVDIRFPAGFVVDTENIQLTGRALGHAMQVTNLENNTYRFSLSGNVDFNEKNGKIFEVNVTVPDTATMNRNYPVQLTHGVVYSSDGSVNAVSVRSGYIYVNPIIEEGLYARFSYDKLLGRVKFANQSSAKAVRYLWEFGDGTTSEEPSPLHEYYASGYYDVKLTAYGELGEDVAEMTILVNDKNYWNIGGTFVLGKGTGGVRHFNAPDTLLRFVSSASVNEDLTLMIEGGCSHTLDITEENTTMLQNLASALSSNGLTFSLAKTGEGEAPTLGFGKEDDKLIPEWIALYNSFVPFSTSQDVTVKLCGITYNPCAMHNIMDQQVKSGEKTQEMDFRQISSDLEITWELTSAPDTDAVFGFLSSGEGNLPSMLIDNIDKNKVDLTYHVTVKDGETLFCEFDKTITVLPGNAYIAEQEWSVLNTLHDKLVAQGWTSPWDMSCGIEGASTLKGVTIERGHVTALDLSNQGLSAEFPTEALHLPRLAKLSFAKNNMNGDVAKLILQDMTAYAAEHPDFESCLERLDLSDNQFTGNVGLLSALSSVFKHLKALNLNNNRMNDVNPLLPATISELGLQGQYVDKMLELEFSAPGFASLIGQIPRLFFYDHTQQTYKDKPKVRISNCPPALSANGTKKYWAVDFGTSENGIHISCQTDNAYKGISGDTLYLSYPYAAPEVKNSYCLTTYNFVTGDVNFIEGTDATDLQTTIMYIFGDYTDKPFNFTAADTYQDKQINVQDVVCLVNILLHTSSTNQPEHAKAKNISAVEQASDANIYTANGKVYLQTSTPIAALHVMASGEVKWNLKQFGMQQSSTETGVVGYSLSGKTIPVGVYEIGECDADVTVSGVSASGIKAQPVYISISTNSTTGMDVVEPKFQSAPIYNIMGVQQKHLGKGVNIMKRNNRYIKIINK